MLSLLKKIYHKLMPLAGALVYGFPSRKLFVIGVTGTKGKTTVTELINAGLEGAGHKTAVNNSIRRKVGDVSQPSQGNSMPGRSYLQKFLREAVSASCKYAIIEVTSEGVRQHRQEHIAFGAAVFINLHPEHIESHGTFEKYRQAKIDFFKYVKKYSKKPHKYFFVNKEDENSRYFADVVAPANVTYFSKSDLPSGLSGDFNKSNVGAAVAVLKKIGIKDAIIFKAIADFKGIPGRMEFIHKDPFAVVVDYAHTPGSLEEVYKAVSDNGQKKLICVLGSAGGGRDKWKRPEFGKIASRYCKEIILTDEDPYDEDPKLILSQIKSGIFPLGGIPQKAGQISKVYEILDRREAIKKAVELAKPGDTVVITGKGSEKVIHVNHGKTIPFSDAATVADILNKL